MANHVSNINVRGRLTQVIVLVVSILAVMLISQLAKAQGSTHKVRYDKAKYRIAVHKNSDKTCYILHKKRTSMSKHPLIASARRPRNQAMAETDQPERLVSSN